MSSPPAPSPAPAEERSTGVPEREHLLHQAHKYDKAVDIVAAYEALFASIDDLALTQGKPTKTVVHFERFPKIKHADGNDTTPDFTVLFSDGTGLAGEIAHLGLHENSVDKLCSQIGRYDDLTEFPGPGAKMANVAQVDVLVITPIAIVNNAVDRVFGDRLANADHPYNPSRPPIIVSVSSDPEKYSYVRSRDPRNGVCDHAFLQGMLDNGYSAPNSFWSPYKAESPFINDPADRLYLAATIWSKVIPSLGPGETTVSAAQVAKLMRTQYGYGRIREVTRALELLHRARFAAKGKKPDTWLIKRPRLAKDTDLLNKIADNATKPIGSSKPKGDLSPARRRKLPVNNQIAWDFDEPVALAPGEDQGVDG